MKNIAKNICTVGLVLLVCAAVGFVFGCPIKRITGLPCPGCGMTRGCAALLRLDFAEAFRWHPLCPLVPVMAVLYVFKDASFGRRFWSCAPALAFLAAAVIVVYIVRMKLYFPNIPPMTADKNSILMKIILGKNI